MPRPKLPSGKKRTVQLAIRFLPSEARKIKAAAGTRGFSAWARFALLKTVDANTILGHDSPPGVTSGDAA